MSDNNPEDEMVNAIICTICEEKYGEEDSTFCFESTPRSSVKMRCPRCHTDLIVLRKSPEEEDLDDLDSCIICDQSVLISDYLNYNSGLYQIASGVYVSVEKEHHGACHHKCLQSFYEKYVKGR